MFAAVLLICSDAPASEAADPSIVAIVCRNRPSAPSRARPIRPGSSRLSNPVWRVRSPSASPSHT